jgi:hypothetical protein
MNWQGVIAGGIIMMMVPLSSFAQQAVPPLQVVGDAIPQALTATPGDPFRGRAIVASRQHGLCLLCHTRDLVEQGEVAHDVVGPAGKEVVDRGQASMAADVDDDLVSVVEQRLGSSAAESDRRAGDEDAGHGVPLSRCGECGAVGRAVRRTLVARRSSIISRRA